ncbi:MAG: hypothetical protein SGJ17_13105 [Hyphomicrobiales bacterium]|nr:hypothetical protein [Hyphomicrobiales bacterium]
MIAMLGAGFTASHVASVMAGAVMTVETHSDCPDDCDGCKPNCIMSNDCAACHSPAGSSSVEFHKARVLGAPLLFAIAHIDFLAGSTLDPPLPPPRLV